MQIIATGITGFDQVLGGGLPANRIHLVQGTPGTGKTTFALQFLLKGAEAGEDVLYITLSETADELRSAAESHDWNLDGIEILELSAADQLVNLDLDQTIFLTAEVELTETTRGLLDALQRVKPKRVVFDTLSEMRLLAGDPFRYRKQILMLKRQLSELGSTVLFLDDDLEESKDIQSMVTGVIELSNDAPGFGNDRRHVRILKLRGRAFMGGYHDMEIRREGLEVYPRLIASGSRGPILDEMISTGDENFDALLGGGLDAGTSVLIMGPAGSGKSTIAAKIAACSAGEGMKAALFVFDERPHTLFARMKGLGVPLDEHVESGRITVQQIDPAELSPGEFSNAVQRAVGDGAKVIIIDSVVGYLNAMAQERFLVLQLHELLTYLGQAGVLALLVLGQSSRDKAPLSPVDLSYLADTIVVTRMAEGDAELERSVGVYKRRSGSHEHKPRVLEIGPKGISVGQPLATSQSLPDILQG